MNREEAPTMDDRMTADPLTVRPDQTIGETLVLMFERNFRHLPVVERGRLVGIVSDRDIRQFLGRPRLSDDQRREEERYLQLPVSEVMSLHPITVKAKSPIGEGVKIMADHKIGALLVVDRDEKLVGIFTESDALQYCLYLIERYQGTRA